MDSYISVIVNGLGLRVRDTVLRLAALECGVENLAHKVTHLGETEQKKKILARYVNDKQSLKDGRKEVIDARNKIKDQLIALHNSSVSFLCFLLAFTVLYYSHTHKMELFEFCVRLISLGVCVYLLYNYWKVIEDTRCSIATAQENLNVRFKMLKEDFKCLSLTKDMRLEEYAKIMLGDDPDKDRRKQVYESAELFDDLERVEKISTIELREFETTAYDLTVPLESSKDFLKSLYAYIIISAAVMLGVTLWGVIPGI